MKDKKLEERLRNRIVHIVETMLIEKPDLPMSNRNAIIVSAVRQYYEGVGEKLLMKWLNRVMDDLRPYLTGKDIITQPRTATQDVKIARREMIRLMKETMDGWTE